MSLKGMQPVRPLARGLHAVLNPAACRMDSASSMQPCAGVPINAPASDGFSPEGRKKLARAAETQGWPPGLTPQGAAPEPTARGPPEAAEVGSVRAACQFRTSQSPRGALALMGRFRWRPPLK